MEIGFLGGGRIVRIMLTAWRAKGQLPGSIVVSDNDNSVRERLKMEFPSVEVVADNTRPAGCDIMFLALHPPAAKTALPELKSAFNRNAVLVSLAPVLTAARIGGLLGGFDRIARMIPNAPSIIGKGYNPVWYAPALGEAEREMLNELFTPLGDAPVVSEETLEAYAVISAMGPTYFWFQLFRLIELGQSFGLERKAATEAVCKMICGAAGTIYKGQMPAEQVLDLIPVKPLAEEEPAIEKIYQERLTTLHQKIKPAG